jgi:DNA-binding FadR family transcriptional regulator
VDFDENSPLREVLNVLELRTGVEIEAAGLAAERASPAQVKKVVEKFDGIQAEIERGGDAVSEDFAFHCEIADATGNPQFKRFLEYLGRFVIPRRTLWDGTAVSSGRARLDLFQREHRQIVQAIRASSPDQARSAMQRHLVNSRARYEKLAAECRKAG